MSDELEKRVADACDPFISEIEKRLEPILKRACDQIYERIYDDVHVFLRDNAHWNLANELRRVDGADRRNAELEAENARLREALDRLITLTSADHIAHDMRTGIFPRRSNILDFVRHIIRAAPADDDTSYRELVRRAADAAARSRAAMKGDDNE